MREMCGMCVLDLCNLCLKMTKIVQKQRELKSLYYLTVLIKSYQLMLQISLFFIKEYNKNHCLIIALF